jgi:spore coat protein CotH
MLFLLLACSDSLVIGTVDPPEDGPRDELEVIPGEYDTAGDTAAPDTDDTDDTDEPAYEDDALFNLDAVHTIDLALSATATRSLGSSPYTYVSGDLTVDGVTYANVGVRIKGRLGSLRYLPQKAALKIDMLEFGETTKLYGEEKINLNNLVQDCAKVHEVAAYGVNRMLGIPVPRVGYAAVTINGEDYGLYSVVEDYDDEFLQRNFADPSGNLYDGDYYLWPDGSYWLLDFNTNTQDYLQLDEGTDVGMADVHAITTALAAGGDLQATLGPLVDLDEHAAFLAAAAWTGHYDSYSYYDNNYRVYFDPARGGRAVFLPWDPDWAFYTATNINALYGGISARCRADATCEAAFEGYLDALSATVPGSMLQTDVENAIALVQPYVRNDPKMEDTQPAVHACQVDLVDWFSRRGGELAALGL